MSVYFTEEQRFRSWWIKGAFIISIIGTLIPFYRIIVFDDSSIPLTPMVIVLVTVVLIATMIFSAKLETEVDKHAIKYRYFPFIMNWKRIEKKSIKHAEVKKYSPIRDYGGYGYRIRFGGDKALNVKGNMGLLIEYDENKKLMIGTQKPEELRISIENLLSTNRID